MDGKNAVFIPFPTANSEEFILATSGGLPEDKKEIIEEMKKRIVVNEIQIAANEKSKAFYEVKVPASTGTLLEKRQSEVKKLDDLIKEYQNENDKFAIAIRELMPSAWRKVDPTMIVCSDSKHLSNVLRSLDSSEDALYLRGHCAAGLNYLQSSDRYAKASIDQIIEMLKNKLRTDFSGSVKVFGCESGESGGSSGESSGPKAFAQMLADAMYKANWRKCSYFGYRENLRTWAINGHKIVGNSDQRAKTVRVKFEPRGVGHRLCGIQ